MTETSNYDGFSHYLRHEDLPEELWVIEEIFQLPVVCNGIHVVNDFLKDRLIDKKIGDIFPQLGEKILLESSINNYFSKE